MHGTSNIVKLWMEGHAVLGTRDFGTVCRIPFPPHGPLSHMLRDCTFAVKGQVYSPE
jgi:hypothetical protein